MRLFRNTNIPFVKIRYVAYAISALLLIVSLIAIFTNSLNWSIDFTSGVSAKVNLKAADPKVPNLQVSKLRAVLKRSGFPEAEIQNIGEPENSSFLIKLKSQKDTDEVESKTKDRIIEIIQTNFPEYVKNRDLSREVIEEIYVVGPKVGGELRDQVTLALVIALILMIIYIWFRFELTFGLMAILALFHDVTIIVGAFAITGKEMTFQIIAALLTIVGYSINDTIVIFDRIREDLKVYRKEPVPVIFNRSMNQTLSRTTITSGTTLLSALALFFFGGSVLHDFAFAMVLGVFFGTYSSIFVASNLVIDAYHITHKEKKGIQHLTKKK
ncbi:MAG TPA: protein translocase subunit SecF [Candidatus Cloacimonadota bacterium]|nr:protein translocase subunit SecF [Candidatus Cloacimonadota bacterium]